MQQQGPTGDPSTSDIKILPILLGLIVLLGVWVFAISSFGVAAFIYPLLVLVALAFAFTLVLTRG